MVSVRITVQPEIFRWVKEISGNVLTKNWLNQLNTWLKDPEKKPTVKQLQNLSQKAQVPFGYFFLDRVPKEDIPLVRFRTIDNVEIGHFSRNLVDTIHDMQRKQAWLSEYRQKNGFSTNQFSHAAQRNNCDEDKYNNQVATAILSDLDLKPGWNVGQSASEAFKILRLKLDENGITVMYNSIVGNSTKRHLDQNEFRAFALDDEYAPFIFINSNDSYRAMLFSLVHELVHIWYGTSELYNDNYEKEALVREPLTEQGINRVTEFIIFPKPLFMKEWFRQTNGDRAERVEQVAKHFAASPLSAAIRAKHLGLINQETIEHLKDQLNRAYQRTKQKQKESKEKGGPQYYVVKAARLDSAFARDIEMATKTGAISFTNAFELLNVKNGPQFDKLMVQVKKRG
ncbi:ImmA/IrrE family metallo-endopeptidase [Schleiferilactobacillus harbinensis]|uniref:ImmA/IrrE family metallo-endopeptidase n=1 Tax=Schleiferilactobacillus harbinensis TaxID=304207 RepID=A0ABU7T336_9LACO